jgi:prepilin-type N-terminal cleavage/methylation domain-containing protein
MKSNIPKKRAFTLIELLVVIAIIAILAAILFPVFAQAKLAAKKASSTSNVKNLTLGLIMYTNDYDDTFSNSEWGSGNTDNTPIYSNWATDNYPYIKNGTMEAEKGISAENNGGDGIFHDTAAPAVSEADLGVDTMYPTSPMPTHQWGFSYGVNENIMVHNDYSLNSTYLSQGELNNSMKSTSLQTPTDSILLMTKGVENTDANINSPDQPGYTYPYFATLESQYLGEATPHYVNGVFSGDGDDSSIPYPTGGGLLADGFVTNPNFDTDCASGACHNGWESVGHPRYRYNGTGVAAYPDGHAKTMTKGALKWYKNIFVQNSGIFTGNAWGAPGEADCWGGIAYQATPY